MKILPVFLAALFFIAVNSYSQEVNQITHNSKERYITTTIGFPVQGTYTPIGMKEPITVLNPDGTGFIQADDLSKKKINWGIECSEEGVAIFKEGFNSKSYTFWYRPTDGNEWYYSQFSIHLTKKKMFLMGERVKVYEDYNVQ